MKNIYRLLLILLSFSVLAPVNAREHQGTNKSANHIKSTAAGCTQATGYRFLDVNNVRARINTGGDMWWDLSGFSKYFIPAAGTATSLYSGALWIGGLDVNGQLKLAAQKFRQQGVDYWTGPLTVDGTAAVDAETCAEYDKHFKVSREEVDLFLNWWASENKEEEFPGYAIPESFYEWPAHGDVSQNQSYYLAPFFDMDKDGDYDPENGDYPYYDIYNELCPINFKDDPNYVPAQTPEAEIGIVTGGILVDQVLKGDQTLWWVFNDKGDAHTESEGAAIGLEIRAQAFAFATNDVVNNMTFYSYEIINRSTFRLTETYFSPWVDTDLGKADDDFVGCDVGRGLGYCYNGNAVDGNNEPESYGAQPPAIGVDFFQGPYLDPDQTDNPQYNVIITSQGDTIYEQIVDESINGINFGNGIVDDERYGMRRFVYHNNGGADYMSDPDNAPEYYNLLRGIWKDNTEMMYGGNAHVSSGAVGPETNFMFPGDSDPWNWGTGGLPPNGGYNQDGKYWTEEEAGNQPFDRRFMQSAGPFVLESGAVNYITVGIPWARAASGGPFASVELLRVVDDKCQALFDNCFKVIDGPNAPDLTFSELDQEVIFYISNRETSNNYGESYEEKDPNIEGEGWDPYYRFEGYQVYQLSDATVTVEDFGDADKARIVKQFDIKNGIGRLINYEYDESLSASVPVLAVDGADNGISHSFIITEDQFAEGNSDLINHKQYYFSVLAYAHNNYLTYSQEPGVLDGLYGQKLPYLSGRKNIKTYTVIPHRAVNGAVMNTSYGEQPQITRIEGKGNGNMIIELTDETVDEIMSRPPADSINHIGTDTYPIAYEAVYKPGYGPVDIRIVDPLNVKGGEFELRFDSMYRERIYDVTGNDAIITGGDTASMMVSGWVMKDLATGKTYESENSILTRNEQIMGDLGFAINLEQIYYSGYYTIGKTPSGNSDPDPNISAVLATNNNVLGSSITFADSSNQWFYGMPDNDLPGTAYDWIRAGSSFASQTGDTKDDDMDGIDTPWDPNGNFEGLVGGTWAPYSMTAAHFQNVYGPAYDRNSRSKNHLSNISSIDFVITSDKSKWTRCPVIEMQNDMSLSEGNAKRFWVRKSPSIDKDGNFADPGAEPSMNEEDANYISADGMGWFPGYAINVETGERLNIIYGENSWLSAENGRDMQWNPTSSIRSDVDFSILFGGMHYIYVMRPYYYEGDIRVDELNFPAYDAGATYYEALKAAEVAPVEGEYFSAIFQSGMWASIPLANQNSFLANDVKIKLRVGKPYARNYTGLAIPDSIETIYGHENNNYPLYQFSTTDDATDYFAESAYDEDLDMIRAVPNPYYAYSTYETVPLDNRIKITNLPDKCSVTIYNMAGTKIREFQKDNAVTSVEWDLKNFAGVPIAGGMYLIHVEADFNGTKKERVIKWLGMLRKSDLNTF